MRNLLTLTLACACLFMSTIPTFAATPAPMPKILSEKDVKLYKRLFIHQRALNRPWVAKQVDNLENDLLLGHLIAERLLHPNTKASYKDLQKWLATYTEHHQSKELFRLANIRKPKNQTHKTPTATSVSMAKYGNPDDKIPRGKSKPEINDKQARKKLKRALKRHREKARYTNAYHLLKEDKTRKLLGETAWVYENIKLARSLISKGHYQIAQATATQAAKVESRYRPEARWLIGLSAYRQNNVKYAAKVWRKLAYQVPEKGRHFARTAWWAARANQEVKRTKSAKILLRMAAQDSTSFYGQLAQQQLNSPQTYTWQQPKLNEIDFKVLKEQPVIQRVIALAQIEEHTLAQKELKAAYRNLPYDMDESLLALATHLKLPNAAFTLSHNLKEQGKTFLTGLYPTPTMWGLRKNQHDTPLIFAIMRQESAFDPSIKSRAGARGLMQFMPATARYIRQREGKPILSQHRLNDPRTSVSLAKDYLTYLGNQMGGNVIHMIAAYNGGIGNVRKWLADKHMPSQDPILFIESMPFKETRHYTKRVIANYWMYQRQLGETTPPTLISMTQNQWPTMLAYIKNKKKS